MAQKLLEGQQTKFQKFISEKGIFIAMASTAFGLFIGIPLVIWFSNVILINVAQLFLLIFIFGFLGLLKWKYFSKYIDIEYYQFAMYSFAGFGMCFTCIALFLNYTIAISSHSETYAIKKIRLNDEYYEVVLEGGKGTSSLEKNVSKFITEHYQTLPQEKTVTVTFDKGLLGFDMVADCKL